MELAADAAPFATDSLVRALCDSIAAGVMVVEPRGGAQAFRIVAVNANARRMAAINAADSLIGRDLAEAFPGARRTGLLDALARVAGGAGPITLNPVYYGAARGSGWYRAVISPLEGGCLLGVFSQLSGAAAAPASLRSSHDHLSLLAASMADGLFDWDLHTDTLYLSPSWKAQLGYADDELPNALGSWTERLHPDERDAVLHSLSEFLAGDQQVWDVEFRLRHRRGDYLWINARARALRDAQSGAALRVVGAHIDIDERRRRQAQANERRRIAEAVVQAMPDLLFLLDEEGTVREYFAPLDSPDLYRPPEAFLQRPVEEWLPPAVARQHRESVHEALRSGELVTYDYSLPMPDGERFYEARLRASACGDRVAMVVRNITGEHHAECELDARLRKLQSLYQIFRLSRGATELRQLARHTTAATVGAVYDGGQAYCHLAFGDTQADAGNAAVGGATLVAPVFDGGASPGMLQLRLAEGIRPSRDDQRFVNAVAEATSSWLRGQRAQQTSERYRRVAERAQDGMALVGPDLCYQLVNPAYAALVGEAPESLLGRRVAAVLPTLSGLPLEERIARVLAGDSLRLREWRPTPRGQRLMDVAYTPFVEDGAVSGVIVGIHDVTDLHEAQAGLRRAARVFASAAEAIMATDAHFNITDVNAAFSRVTGFAPERAIGRPASMLGAALRGGELLQLASRPLADDGQWRGEMQLERENGEPYVCRMTISAVDREDPSQGYVGVFADITAQKQHEQQLEHLAHHDPLTGLFSRAHFLRALERTIELAERQGDRFSVMFIDLDHFKEVNDSIGHDAGDEMLRVAARRLNEQLRANDILGRLGGDEFVALLPGVSGDSDAPAIAEKILNALRAPVAFGPHSFAVSASIGICSYPADGRTATELLSRSDRAMYRAKQARRNAWCRYSADMTH